MSSEDVQDALYEQWREQESRAVRAGGYNAGHRCWGCRRFVGGPTVTCGHCGQRHGGIFHDAYPTR